MGEFSVLKNAIKKERTSIEEFLKFNENIKDATDEEALMIKDQISVLEEKIKKNHIELKEAIEKSLFSKPLEIEKKKAEDKPTLPKYGMKKIDTKNLTSKGGRKFSLKEIKAVGLEGETIEEIKKKKKKEEEEKKKKDTDDYTKIASQMFSKYSRKLLGKKSFKQMEDALVRANLNYTPVGYISVIVFTTFISAIIAAFLFLFFLFFNLEAVMPIITRATDPINIRFAKVVWILFVVPISTFIFMYLYPSMEKSSAEDAINQELPFATIHMAAISGSMINPIKIFEIIISTGEYPAISKEFTKMINEINLYGYDLVSALRNTAKNSPSKRLKELLNGLTIAIHSGGDLSKFFDKRAQTLLFNHKLEQQKASKSAETFMDMYISIVIAAPMILMLLMMIMKISGLGIPMSINGIALLIIIGVVVINVIFMAFLHLKKK